ncbi:hypothetical protein LAZ67_18001552 [Cordylochernes scorpioides]|uniref:UBN2_3 domain-containing protein n=1 Tax=Cordylochernes scorpioides TaxID=51811 RepID=A0ABY6LFW4_9ARAC|nr:hypothetical protein LAZ67_18001552 [Cordylochernes scorpioides]
MVGNRGRPAQTDNHSGMFLLGRTPYNNKLNKSGCFSPQRINKNKAFGKALKIVLSHKEYECRPDNVYLQYKNLIWKDKSSWEIWSDKNDEAFGIIITTLTNDQAGMFIGETNAKKVWDSLKKTYTVNLEDKIIDIGLELKNIRMKDKMKL